MDKEILKIGAVTISQSPSKKWFTVQYGEQIKPILTYAEAAKELGDCLMHQAVCDGLILINWRRP